jgi:biotin transport system substrate-specific component
VPSPRRLPARDLALIALFAALIAALGLPGTLSPFGSAVPITAQTLGVMLAGSILGAKRAFLAVLTFDVLVLAGLPLLAGGRGGLGVLAHPSAGYFLAFPVGAFVIGWLTEKAMPRYSIPFGMVANVVGGIGVIYAVGVPVQAARADLSGPVAILLAAAVYLPGDLIKAAVATAVAKGVHAGYPTLGRELATSRSGRNARPEPPGDPAGGPTGETVRPDGHLP